MYDDGESTAPKPQGVTGSIRQLADDLDARRHHIEAALSHADGTHTYDDVCLMVLQGRLRFWPMRSGFFMTEVLAYPQENHYHMFLGGGDLTEILDMHETIEAAAREAGCSKLSVAGRRGWVRALKDHGWTEQLTVCVKRI